MTQKAGKDVGPVGGGSTDCGEVGPKAIRVVFAEDQALVLGALAALLRLEDDFDVVGEATDGREALELVRRCRPDILVADIEMPSMSGIELAHKLKALPEGPKIVLVTAFARSGYFRRAMEAGVRGYLLKDAPVMDLAQALREIYRGRRIVDPELAIASWGDTDPLTNRERQVLRLAGAGHGGTEISKALALSEGTVRNYISRAIGKLGATNRVEAARLAREKGWL